MKKKIFLLLSVSIFGAYSCFAQQSINASGGNMTGSNGNVSYSVGQVVYTTNTGSNVSVAQGVQQPYEISVVLASENFQEVISSLSIFPNPSTNVLNVNFSNSNELILNYQFFDINGRIIREAKNISDNSVIDVSDLSAATYFLKITNENKEIKTFKIIKN